MAQYVPTVSDSDIERIIWRDYPSEVHTAIHHMIRGVEVREKARVIMACLKNAQGNLEKLEGELANAGGYYREMIAEAEYPNYTKKAFLVEQLSAIEKERIIEKDKNQYLTWLHADAANEKGET